MEKRNLENFFRELPMREWAKIHASLVNQKRAELMLKLYPKRELSFEELKEMLKVGSVTLDYHLKLLQENGLIENVLEGRNISHYRLSEKGRKVLETTIKLLEEESKYRR